jgi:hypothetical protein
VDQEIDTLVSGLLDKFPECTRYTKQQTNFWKNLAWHQTAGHARDWLSIHYCSLEPWEGMNAFVEKRKVDYRGVRRRAVEDTSSEFVHGPYSKSCKRCQAKGLPKNFKYCGACGAEL